MKILGSFQQISDPNVSVVAEAERDRLATLETVAANRIQGLAKMKQAKAERIRLQAEREQLTDKQAVQSLGQTSPVKKISDEQKSLIKLYNIDVERLSDKKYYRSLVLSMHPDKMPKDNTNVTVNFQVLQSLLSNLKETNTNRYPLAITRNEILPNNQSHLGENMLLTARVKSQNTDVAANRIQGLAKMKQAKAERIRLQAERDAISKEIQEFLDNYNLWHDVEVIGSQNPVDEFYAKYSENTRKYIDSFIKKKEGFNFHRDLSNHNFIKLSRNIPQKGIEYFIKELIMRDPTRKNDLNKTSQRGSFERGVVVISDLTASEAEKINQYLDTLDLYKRPSTHGDLVWGYDIPSNRYIESPNEIFRHVIFSKPKKHKTKDDLNSGTTERTSKQLERAHRYYFRIKPESYGTNNYLDYIRHGASYIATRIDSQYKKAPGYYGDGDSNMQKNGNGVFVINKQDMFAWGDRDTNLY